MESKYMAAKIIFTIVFFFNILIVSAQIKISFEEDCIDKNTILLSQFLIDVMGDDFISNFLEEHNALLFFFEVDSFGQIVEVIRIRERKEIDNTSKEKIVSALKLSDIEFTKCYWRTVGQSDSAAYERISKDLFNEKKPTVTLNVAFPGFRYEVLSLKEDDEKTGLSKLQILKKWIEENDCK